MTTSLVRRAIATAASALLVMGFGATQASAASASVQPHASSTGTVFAVRATPTPSTVPFFGATVTVNYRVTNVTNNPATITAMVDQAGTTIGASGCVVGTKLGRGASCSFSRNYSVSGNSSPLVLSITVTGTSSNLSGATTATAPIALVFPSANVVVTAAPNVTAVPALGGRVTITVTVKNPKQYATQSIAALHDDWYGSSNGGSGCTIGTVLAPLASCSYPVSLWVSGKSGSTFSLNFDAALREVTQGTLYVGEGTASWSFA